MPTNSIPWALLEEKHVVDYLIQEQIHLLNQCQEKKEGTQHLTNILNDICAYIQSRVPSALHPNPIQPNHIPLACKTIACYLIIEAIYPRVLNTKLTDDQVRNIQQAHEMLDQFCKKLTEQINPKCQPRIEAVRYRQREAQQSTLKGY